MSNTRTVVAPGVFADDALITIPPTPVQGTAYRNPAISLADVEKGWPYGIPPMSDVFNQIMFQVTTLVSIMDQQGMLGWTNAKNYDTGDHVLGSDKVMYRCATPNGPTLGGARDPVSEPTYWARTFVLATNAETITGSAVDRAVTPAGLTNLFNGSGRAVFSANGYQRLPGGLIIQWLTGTVPGPTALNFTWPVAFPNAVLNAQISNSGAGVSSTAYLSGLTTAGGSADFNSAADGGSVFIFAVGY